MNRPGAHEPHKPEEQYGELQRRLGRNLRAVRVARGYSQEAFADELGFHRTYLGALERGERNLSCEAWRRWPASSTSIRLRCCPALAVQNECVSADGVEGTPRPLNREEITPWLEVAQGTRVNVDVLGRLMPPKEGSFLRPTEEDPLKKMAWWCHGFLEAAADHLLLWADYAAPLKFHPEAETVHTLRPAFTLARAVMESAAQVIWVLSPEEVPVRGRRFVQLVLWDLDEQTKAAVGTDAHAELRQQRDAMFAACGGTARTFRPPRYLDMIRGVAEFLNDDDPVDPLTPDRVERVWRSTAGAAHGKQWPEFEFNSRVEVAGGLFSSTPKVAAISEVLKVADKFPSVGVLLFAMSTGHGQNFTELWDDAEKRLTQRLQA